MANKNDRLQLGKVNFILLAVAAVLLIAGYVIMSSTRSPFRLCSWPRSMC